MGYGRAAWPQSKENHIWSLYRKPAVQDRRGQENAPLERTVSIGAGTLNSRTPPSPTLLTCDLSWTLYLSSPSFIHPPLGDVSNL